MRHQRFILPEGHPLTGGYDVVICEKCSFVFADTAIPQSAYDAFYERLSKYDDAKTSTGGGGSKSDMQRLDETARDVSALISPDARILDIGCAGGGLLHALQNHGFQHLNGLDPSSNCVRYGKETFNLEMYQGTLQHLPDLGQFDVIILSHVLEHVQDLRSSMQSIRQLLKPNGHVYVEVPDATRYAECLIAPFQDFNTEHINHFSEQSLTNLAAAFGFTVETSHTKTLEAAANNPYPAVWQLWKIADTSEFPKAKYIKDALLQESLANYIGESQKILDGMNAKLQSVVGAPIVVWGTGQLAMKLLAETVLGECDIALWIDSNAVLHGHELHGAKVLSPQEGASRLRETPMPIVISSTIHAAAIKKSIINELKLDVQIIDLLF
ncbi:MAG: class I SAM-dependent methyltransferase [Abditibacteriaceae bacterium]